MFSNFSICDEIDSFVNNKAKEECSICFEERVLKKYCKNNHSFCATCCKSLVSRQTLFSCPMCRSNCNNINFLSHNFECNADFYDELTKPLLNFYFRMWHKPSCVKKKHLFKITKKGAWKIIFCCKDCNIEQSFPYVINNEYMYEE